MTRLRVKQGVGAVVMSVALLGAGAMYAQGEPEGPGQGFGEGGFRCRGFHRGLMAGILGLDQLGLSDQQRQQIRTVMQQHREELRALGEKVGAAHKAQHDAVMAVPFDEGQVRARANELAAVQADMAVMRARIHNEVFQVLTPEQQAKAQQLRAERAQRAAERRQRWSQRSAPRQ